MTIELTPRKIGKPKYNWLPAYYGGACSPPRPPYGDGRDTYHAKYCDENDEWHVLFDRYCDEYPGVEMFSKLRDVHIMVAYLMHLYEVEETPELVALAERILEKPYGWTVLRIERNELIKLVEQNLHVQKEMFE